MGNNKFTNNLVTTYEGITIGATIHNPDCGDYTVVAINQKLDRTLLVKNNSIKPDYVGAWALQKTREENGWYWSQGHYMGSNLEGAVSYVLGKECELKKVWVISTDWSIDSGEHASYCYLYNTYEVAKKEFDKLVNEDKNCNYESYYNDKESGFEWEEKNNYWNIWESDNYSNSHSEIKLEEKVIQKEI